MTVEYIIQSDDAKHWVHIDLGLLNLHYSMTYIKGNKRRPLKASDGVNKLLEIKGYLVKSIQLFIFILLNILFLPLAYGVDFNLEIGKETSVCKTVLENVRSKERDGKAYYDLKALIPTEEIYDWKESKYYLKMSANSKHESKQKILLASIDIDNDGDIEKLVIDSYFLRGRQGDILYVFEELDFNEFWSQDYVLNNTRWSYNGLKSKPNWPYSDFMIFMPQIYIFKYGGKNMIAVKDLYFGTEKGRAIILSEYSGGYIEYRKGKDSTIKLDVLCQIVSDDK